MRDLRLILYCDTEDVRESGKTPGDCACLSPYLVALLLMLLVTIMRIFQSAMHVKVKGELTSITANKSTYSYIGKPYQSVRSLCTFAAKSRDAFGTEEQTRDDASGHKASRAHRIREI